jgi:acetamidase/formamidase
MVKQGKVAVLKYSSYVFATMMELPIFVFGIYALMVMQEYLNGIGHSLAQALNAIYLQAGEDLSAFDMLNNLDYYLLGSLVDVSLRVLSLVLIYRVIFTLHTLILNAIQSQSENTLEQIAESAVQNASRWSNKV